MKYKHRYSLAVAAAKAGMTAKTARKYSRSTSLDDGTKQPRQYRTRKNPFAEHWAEIETLLRQAPELQAKTLLQHLINRYPDRYSECYLRTLQRRLKQFHAEQGKNKAGDIFAASKARSEQPIRLDGNG
jgi:hypothetical protein